MFLMLAITVVDVAGRYVFGVPVYGSYELMEFLLAMAAFAALPLATVRREHVTISLFDGLFAKNRLLNTVKDALVGLITAAIFFFAGWIMWVQGADLHQFGTKSSIYEVPSYFIAYFISVVLYLTGFLALRMAVLGFILAVRGADSREQQQGSR